MGYKPVKKQYKLVFAEDDDLHGLEITVQSLTLGELRTMQAAGTDPAKGVFENQDDEVAEFVARVTEWNLEDEDGNELPITVESLRTIAYEDIRRVIQSWCLRSMGVGAADPFSQKPSNDGETSETTPNMEEFLPRETLSSPRAS